jgi:hypothetical protein
VSTLLFISCHLHISNITFIQVPAPRDEEPSEAETLSEDEVEKEIAKSPLSPPQPARKSRPKPKPAYKGQKDAPTEDKQAGPSKANRGAQNNDSEVEEIEMSEKAKGKRKAREESDVEVVDSQPPEKKGRRKGKAAFEGEVVSAKPRSRGAGRAGSEAAEAAKHKRTKPASRADSKVPATAPEGDDSNMVEDDAAPKKKKRKINIFPTSQPTSFPWGELPQVGLSLILLVAPPKCPFWHVCFRLMGGWVYLPNFLPSKTTKSFRSGLCSAK